MLLIFLPISRPLVIGTRGKGQGRRGKGQRVDLVVPINIVIVYFIGIKIKF